MWVMWDYDLMQILGKGKKHVSKGMIAGLETHFIERIVVHSQRPIVIALIMNSSV
jgi:hypothetical protein